ncbi:hypothetical protein HanIR_Chr03g0102851 [Helianthus annuus]|nr:hypothetical protein HanIR_Chr03g0102851 [Helianthus annuus]
MLDGIIPSTSFLDKSNNSNNFMSPIFSRILPVNRLLDKFKNLNSTSCVISLGITPCKRLLERSKYVTKPRMLPYPYTLPLITNHALPINSCCASSTIGFGVTFPVMTLKLLKQFVFPRCMYIICFGSTEQRKSFRDTDERLLSEIFRYCRPGNVLQNQLGMLSEIRVLSRYKINKSV